MKFVADENVERQIILFLRSEGYIETSEAKIKLVREIIIKIGDKLEGNFVVVSEGGYRLRPL